MRGRCVIAIILKSVGRHLSCVLTSLHSARSWQGELSLPPHERQRDGALRRRLHTTGSQSCGHNRGRGQRHRARDGHAGVLGGEGHGGCLQGCGGGLPTARQINDINDINETCSSATVEAWYWIILCPNKLWFVRLAMSPELQPKFGDSSDFGDDC